MIARSPVLLHAARSAATARVLVDALEQSTNRRWYSTLMWDDRRQVEYYLVANRHRPASIWRRELARQVQNGRSDAL
jgi:hypothetical protein